MAKKGSTINELIQEIDRELVNSDDKEKQLLGKSFLAILVFLNDVRRRLISLQDEIL